MKELQILFFAIMIFMSKLHAFDVDNFIQALKSEKIEQIVQLFEDGFDGDISMNNQWIKKTTYLMYVARQSDQLKYCDYSSLFYCEVARMLLNAGVSIDAKNEYGKTAFMIACSYGEQTTDMNMIRLFIDYGTNIHVQDNNGNTALMLAAYSGNIEVVKLLLQLGVDPFVKNKYNSTVLMAICSHYNDEVGIDMNLMRLLIKQNTDVNLQDLDGETALMLAARYGNIEVVKLLLQLGADPFMKNKDGKRALQLAKHSWVYHFNFNRVSREQEKKVIAVLKAAERKIKNS